VSTTAILVRNDEDVSVPTIELRHSKFGAERDWYGLRSHERAQPLSDVGCRALAFHIATTTLKSR